MKTTRMTVPANLNIVTLRRGAQWVKFSTSKGQFTAWLESSDGDAFSVSLDGARDRIALALGGGFKVAA